MGASKILLSFLFSFSLCLASLYTGAQALVINEILSSNEDGIQDEDGDFEDWIELYNGTSSIINLKGYMLSDDLNNPDRWVFPEVLIYPSDHLILFASGKDRTDGSFLHTNFSISKNGEPIILSDTTGYIIDYVPAQYIPSDISYGRYPDGAPDFFFFATPTPGTPNSSNHFEEFLNPPVFSHSGGCYTSPFQLTLSAPDSAIVYYTTDGSYPDQQNAVVYENPIPIHGAKIIRAFTYKDGALKSETETHIYNILADELHNFQSNLPLIVLNQFDTLISPGERSFSAITINDLMIGGEVSLIADSTTFQNRALTNKRGSSSLSFPKNMFGFHLLNEKDGTYNASILEMPAEHNWILYAPYTDMTLMRNVLAYQLSEDMGWYAPRTHFVELFLHHGNGTVDYSHYHGVYVLVERIKWDNNRVDITKISPNDNQEPEITGGYIISKDRLDDDEVGFATARGTILCHVRPQEADVTPQQRQWISDYMSAFEDALFSSDFDDPDKGYRNYVDENSFIDHFLITELLKEIDGYRLSTFMYKDRNEKLIMGPLWDFNLSLGIADYLEGWKPEGWYYSLLSEDDCPICYWYVRLLEDDLFEQNLKLRWWDLRQTVFSKDYLTAMIAYNKNLLAEAQVRNFQRWPTLGTYIWPNWYIGDSFEDEVNWMENWLLRRLLWMDRQLKITEPYLSENAHLIHYWHFSDTLPNNTPLKTIDASYSIGEPAYIEFFSALSGYPYYQGHELWRKASLERRNNPTPVNYQLDIIDGTPYPESNIRGIQVRQPLSGDAGENALVFHIPTKNYKNIEMSFAATNEGAADAISIEYAIDENMQWLSDSLIFDEIKIHEIYENSRIDFSNIHSVNDNAFFKVRFKFLSSDMHADDGKRITFNNISVAAEKKNEKATFFQNYPNPFKKTTQINCILPSPTDIKIEIFNTMGQHVETLNYYNVKAGPFTIEYDASTKQSGLYLYRIYTNSGVHTGKMIVVD